MKQRRAEELIHQSGMCIPAPRAVPTGVTFTAMPTAGWSTLGTVALSERSFGKRLDGNGIPTYGTCRPKEPST